MAYIHQINNFDIDNDFGQGPVVSVFFNTALKQPNMLSLAFLSLQLKVIVVHCVLFINNQKAIKRLMIC